MLNHSSNLPRTKSGDSTAAGHQLLLPPLHLPLGKLKNVSFSDNAQSTEKELAPNTRSLTRRQMLNNRTTVRDKFLESSWRVCLNIEIKYV